MASEAGPDHSKTFTVELQLHARNHASKPEYVTRAEGPSKKSAEQRAAQTPTGSLALKGQQIFKGAGGCTACHGIVGVNLKSSDDPAGKGLIGPNLTHFGGRTLIAGGVLDNNAGTINPTTGLLDHTNNNQCQPGNLANCDLAKWLHDPQGVKPGSLA